MNMWSSIHYRYFIKLYADSLLLQIHQICFAVWEFGELYNLAVVSGCKSFRQQLKHYITLYVHAYTYCLLTLMLKLCFGVLSIRSKKIGCH